MYVRNKIGITNRDGDIGKTPSEKWHPRQDLEI
jgi:hypothetical protein